MIYYEFGPESIVENQKVSNGFKLALEILNRVEGYDKYNEMITALAKLNDIVAKAKIDVVPDAIKWAWEFKDDSVIYTMGSGSCCGPAHLQLQLLLQSLLFFLSERQQLQLYLYQFPKRRSNKIEGWLYQCK